jgi:hypothetical protein
MRLYGNENFAEIEEIRKQINPMFRQLASHLANRPSADCKLVFEVLATEMTSLLVAVGVVHGESPDQLIDQIKSLWGDDWEAYLLELFSATLKALTQGARH